MPITTLPRAIIKASLQGLRLPLTAIERITSNADAAQWPPAVVFESFEAGTKKVLGSLIRDDELVREGTLQEAKLKTLANADRLEAAAERKRHEAEAKFEAREESVEQARARAEDQAQRREAQLQHEKAEKERKVAEATEQREEAAERAAQARDKVVTGQERDATRTRIAQESAALSQRGQALGAAKKAQTLDIALEAKRAQRKSG